MKWINCIFRRQKAEAGNSLPPATKPISECYAERDLENRWQGDVYQSSNFAAGSIPDTTIYWMLANRTCHLVETGGRQIKVQHLVYVATYPIHRFVTRSKSLKEQVATIIKQHEGCIYLPPCPNGVISEHLVADFNLLYTVAVDKAPKASQKLLQLSSPFSEHVFQKFAKYFYTVGFDDNKLKSSTNIAAIVEHIEKQNKK